MGGPDAGAAEMLSGARRFRRPFAVPTAVDANAALAMLVAFGGQVGVAGFSMVAAVVTSRVLGPSGRGEVAAAVNVAALAYLLGTLGLSPAVAYFAARGTIAYPVLLGNSLVMGAMLGGVTAIATVGVATVFPAVMGDVPSGLLVLGVLWFPFTFTELYLSYLIIGRQRLFASNALNLVARVVSLLLISLACLAFPHPATVVVLTQGYSVIRLVLNLVYMRRMGFLVRPRVELGAFWTKLGYATRGRGNDVLNFLNMRLDVVLLNVLSTPAAVGVYATAAVISELTWQPSLAVSKVIFPRTAAAPDAGAALATTLASTRVTFALTVLVGILVGAVGWVAIPVVFGDGFAGARSALLVLLPGSALWSLSRVLTAALSGMGLPQIGSVVAGASFALTITGDLLLIPRYGVNGAAVASTVAYAGAGLVAVGVFARTTGTRPRDSVVLRSSDLLAVTSGLGRVAGLLRGRWS